MWRILLIALLFYLIIWLIRGLVTPSDASKMAADENELVCDALTGVYFPKNKAVSLSKDGRKMYFCSIDNRDQWLHKNGHLT
jgi:hypothetical protein